MAWWLHDMDKWSALLALTEIKQFWHLLCSWPEQAPVPSVKQSWPTRKQWNPKLIHRTVYTSDNNNRFIQHTFLALSRSLFQWEKTLQRSSVDIYKKTDYGLTIYTRSYVYGSYCANGICRIWMLTSGFQVHVAYNYYTTTALGSKDE